LDQELRMLIAFTACDLDQVGGRWEIHLRHLALVSVLPSQPLNDALVALLVHIFVEARVQSLHDVHNLLVHPQVVVSRQGALGR